MRIATASFVLALLCLAPSVARADSQSAHDLVTHALIDHDYAYALSLASSAAVHWPKAIWPQYDRGVALKHLGRTDEALRAFARVEGNPAAGPFKELAVFGRARALDDAGRCQEAQIAYSEYAALMQPRAPQAVAIAMADSRACYEHARVDPRTTQAASALMAGDYARVLRLTQVPASDRSGQPWLDYDRASALTALGKTDEAVETFARAEQEFGEQRWERSIAIWGAARAYDNAGRCTHAAKEYNRYAELTRPYDPAAADMAERFSKACTALPVVSK